MIVLGIDTAIRCTGYGIIEMKSLERISVLDCGIIKNPPKMRHSECLRRLSCGIKELVDAYRPHAASIEDVFFSKNIKTAMILSLARGAVISVLAKENIGVFPYSPRTAKRAVVGTGRASKQQVATMMSSMLNLSIQDIPQDATDALALAICHAQVALRPELEALLPQPI